MTTPTFLYRAMQEEPHARKFVHEGVVWLSRIDRYRKIENLVRQDSGEGTAQYLAPMEDSAVTHPAELVKTTSSMVNPVFLLCMADPSVEPRVLARFGSHVIRIHDPNALYQDLKGYFQNGPKETRGILDLRKVSYTRDEPVDPALDERNRHRLIYSQKSVRHEAEREWRIALIVFEPPRSERAIACLEKRLEYCELLPNYSMNPPPAAGYAER